MVPGEILKGAVPLSVLPVDGRLEHDGAMVPSAGERDIDIGHPDPNNVRNPVGFRCAGDEAAAALRGVGQGRASKTRLNGVSVARRKRLNPASPMILASCASGTWLPRAYPPACACAPGVQMNVDPE